MSHRDNSFEYPHHKVWVSHKNMKKTPYLEFDWIKLYINSSSYLKSSHMQTVFKHIYSRQLLTQCFQLYPVILFSSIEIFHSYDASICSPPAVDLLEWERVKIHPHTEWHSFDNYHIFFFQTSTTTYWRQRGKDIYYEKLPFPLFQYHHNKSVVNVEKV